MQVIFDSREAWSIMALIVSQVVDGVELSEEGRAAVRKWRDDYAEGTKQMGDLAEAMNEALGNLIDEQTRRRIRGLTPR